MQDVIQFPLQIRKLSVKRITSPLVYDNLKNAIPNGLYDAAMGPMETQDRHASFVFTVKQPAIGVSAALLHSVCI